MTPEIPVVIYGAKSTEDPRGSIPTQLADCRAAIERAGGREVVGEFSDEAKSAYHGARGDGLAQAKAAASAAAASHGQAEIWVQHTDRLARGDAVTAPHLIEIVLWAKKAGIRVRSVQDDSTGENLLMAAMMGERNHEDSRRKSEATKSGLARRQEKRMHHGGPRRYGYDCVRDEYGRTVPDEPLRVVPGEAPVVERMFRDYVAGMSQTRIARTLNHDGHQTARGKLWRQDKISAMLRNPLYAGLIADADGNLVEAEHEAIIDRDLWDRAQALLRAQERAPGMGRGRPPKLSYLFVRGMLKCGRCGESMRPSTTSKASGDYGYYVCTTRQQLGPDACAQRAGQARAHRRQRVRPLRERVPGH